MARLEWDKTGERNYEMGVSKGVLYKHDETGAYKGGAVVWNGLTGVTESPEGAEPTDLYADNIKYASFRSAETYNSTIEAYSYPAEFAECDGSVELAPGVYAGQQKRVPFGFSYQTVVGNDASTDSDKDYKIHLVYGLTASPSDKGYETINDSPDAITFSWETESTPVNIQGHKPVSTITIDSTVVDKTKLASLEEKLYGTTEGEAYLPLPDEIVQIFGTSVANF